jgi:arylsulfatase A-like enzyme
MTSRKLIAIALVTGFVLTIGTYWYQSSSGLEAADANWPLGTMDDIAALRERDDVNVLFILIDTLRADRLGAWGYERDTSPMLDHLAGNGVRFARHLSQSSWTKCSMASLWTGLYPARTGVLRFDHVLAEGATLPAEIFREAGFRTGALYRNGWVSSNFGFSQGFEVYQRPTPRPMKASERRDNPSATITGSDSDAVDDAKTFLNIHRNDRWFLYLHLMDIHQYVYDGDSALFGTRYSDIYDNSIHRLDRIIEQLMVYLLEEDLLRKTLIVVSSDHGEGFQERGFEGHARNVYREVTEVPFLIAFPFQLESGVVINERTENVDVWPTVLDLVGLPAMPDTDGESLRPQILSGGTDRALESDSEFAFAELDQTWGRGDTAPAPMVAVAADEFRFVSTSTGKGREELFDHSADPLETENILDEHVELGAELRSAVATYLDSSPPPWGEETPTLELDEMELNQLRALGYAIP